MINLGPFLYSQNKGHSKILTPGAPEMVQSQQTRTTLDVKQLSRAKIIYLRWGTELIISVGKIHLCTQEKWDRANVKVNITAYLSMRLLQSEWTIKRKRNSFGARAGASQSLCLSFRGATTSLSHCSEPNLTSAVTVSIGKIYLQGFGSQTITKLPVSSSQGSRHIHAEQYKGNTILQVVRFNPVRTWTMARFNHLRNQCGPFHCVSSPVAESHRSILSNLLHQLNFKKHIKGHHQLVLKSLLNVYRTKEVLLQKPTKDNTKWAPNWFNI